MQWFWIRKPTEEEMEARRLREAERVVKKALKRQKKQQNAAISAQMHEAYNDFEKQNKKKK